MIITIKLKKVLNSLIRKKLIYFNGSKNINDNFNLK
jgi:hypothetical protein